MPVAKFRWKRSMHQHSSCALIWCRQINSDSVSYDFEFLKKTMNSTWLATFSHPFSINLINITWSCNMYSGYQHTFKRFHDAIFHNSLVLSPFLSVGCCAFDFFFILSVSRDFEVEKHLITSLLGCQNIVYWKTLCHWLRLSLKFHPPDVVNLLTYSSFSAFRLINDVDNLDENVISKYAQRIHLWCELFVWTHQGLHKSYGILVCRNA